MTPDLPVGDGTAVHATPTSASYDLGAAEYEARAQLDEPLAASPWRMLLRHLPARSKVLDVGAGPAITTAALSALGHRALALEPSTGLAALAANRAQVLRAGATALPVLTASFDATASVAVLHHLDAPAMELALLEMLRATRPGGLILVSTQLLTPDRPPGLEPAPWGGHRSYRGSTQGEVLRPLLGRGATLLESGDDVSTRPFLNVLLLAPS